MRNVLRRLWPRRNTDPIAPDLAGGDWTPPPPSEVGACDWAHWLSEEPPPRLATTPTPEAIAVPLNLTLPSALADQSDDIVGIWADSEALEEIEEEPVVEPIVGEAVPVAAEPVAAEPVAAKPATAAVETVAPLLPPRRRRDTLGGGRARIRTPMPERRWRDVLSGYAEHLTDEELAIIRKQMAK